MHIAVTGGTGFVGQHLIRALVREGHEVSALTRRTAPQRSDNINWVAGALDDPESLTTLVADADTVLHLAGLTKAISRSQFFDVNQLGVRALCSAIVEAGHAPHFVLVSTLAASQPRLSAYAASKSAGEAELTDNSSDLDWTIVRPPVVYGPGDQEFLKIVKAAAFGLAASAAPRGSRISMIHVSDLVDALLAITRARGPMNQIVEPDDGTEGGYTIEELMELLSRVLGRRSRSMRVPKALLIAIGAVNQSLAYLTRKPVMLSVGKAKELSRGDWLCHDQALIRSTGWMPEVSLAEGLSETVDWYRNEGHLR